MVPLRITPVVITAVAIEAIVIVVVITIATIMLVMVVSGVFYALLLTTLLFLHVLELPAQAWDTSMTLQATDALQFIVLDVIVPVIVGFTRMLCLSLLNSVRGYNSNFDDHPRGRADATQRG